MNKRRSLFAIPAAALLLASCSFELDYDKYAIVYGISDYPGTANDLQWCDEDADAVAALLDRNGYEVTQYTRKNDQATKTNFVGDLADIAARAGEDDLLVIYYSGHGGQGPADPAVGTETAAEADSYEEWIFLHDSIIYVDNPSPQPDQYLIDFDATVNDDELAGLLATVRCRARIVILDACNSGGFLGNQLEADGTPTPYSGSADSPFRTLSTAIRLYASFDGYNSDVTPLDAIVLAAAGERESSFEGLYNHGVFTYFLLQSADRGDRNADGYVTVSEAYDYAARMIDRSWNYTVYGSTWGMFAPHVSGGPVDYVLFGSGR